jgi:acetyltransferase-like isoleucine patch superfamily enzyme
MKNATAYAMALFPSWLRVVVLRIFLKSKIGKGVKISIGCVLIVSDLQLADYARIGPFSYIRCEKLLMGKRAKIGRFVHVSVNTLRLGHRATVGDQVDIAGNHDHNGIVDIGMYSWIFQYSYINAARPVTLGKNVGIGGGTYIFTHGFWLSKLDGFPVSYGAVRIDDDTWLPWGCFVMPDVHIGSKVVVGARSVITKSVPDGVLVAGTPAKIVRDKSSLVVSMSEKAAMFTNLIKEYADNKKFSLSERQAELSVYYKLNDKFLIAIHSSSFIQPVVEGTVLNVYWETPPDELFLRAPIWSLANYMSSPENKLSKQAINFLAYARTIGLRFYPIDEINQ